MFTSAFKWPLSDLNQYSISSEKLDVSSAGQIDTRSVRFEYYQARIIPTLFVSVTCISTWWSWNIDVHLALSGVDPYIINVDGRNSAQEQAPRPLWVVVPRTYFQSWYRCAICYLGVKEIPSIQRTFASIRAIDGCE